MVLVDYIGIFYICNVVVLPVLSKGEK